MPKPKASLPQKNLSEKMVPEPSFDNSIKDGFVHRIRGKSGIRVTKSMPHAK